MKSKFTFSPADFKAGGQMIIRQSSPVGNASGASMTCVAYKVGWRTPLEGPNKALLISLQDGMCIEYEDMEALCGVLNKDESGFRPMSGREIKAVMEYVGNRFPT